MTPSATPRLLRAPSDLAGTEIGRYLDWLQHRYGVDPCTDYARLWAWSVGDPSRFWSSIWEFFAIRADGVPVPVLADPRMPGARWFPHVRLNYAEHALINDRPDSAPAIIAHDESGSAPRTLSYGQLREQVARARAGLKALGVGSGDRVAACLPNITETVVAFLATASLGAVWSCCSPEFGVHAILDRFSQIEPAVLLVVDGYRFGGKTVDLRGEHDMVRDGLPTVRHTVRVPSAFGASARAGMLTWDDLLAETGPLQFDRVTFDHPLFVLYSSGTTGRPKAIVHGHGGMLLTHLKDGALHLDVRPGDRFFWYTTTSWMMWNTVVSGLLAGAAIVLYDGDPAYPDLDALWRLAAADGLTHFGVNAPFLMGCRAADLDPAAVGDLSALRFVGSTGSPLPADGYAWFYAHVDSRVILGSLSGGTDVCSLLVGSSPLAPVWAGEMSCRALGVPVDSFDPDGHRVVDSDGELVVTGPIPAMPVALYGDADGSLYRSTWFDTYPGIWRQGDWITITTRGTAVIRGRSDAALNRGGVRLGTAEFYNVLEALPDITDSLVVHLDDPATAYGRLAVFIVPADPLRPLTELEQLTRQALREELSPRHVPDLVVVTPEIPRTRTGKKLEVPVKRLLLGADRDSVTAPGTLANPGCLDFFTPALLAGDASTTTSHHPTRP